MKATQIDFLQLARQFLPDMPSTLRHLKFTHRNPTTHHLRDGDVVLYQRPTSQVWQEFKA